MSKVYKALGFSVLSSWVSRALNLASIVIIARLLSPEELGVFAIASAITLIAAELKSFGVGGYLIREDKIDIGKVSNALGLSMLLSWGAGLTMVASSWAIASYYDMPDIAVLVQWLSISFFLSPHIGIGKSLLDRYFQFKHKMLVQILSQFIQFISATTFVLLGHSYFSLAYANAISFAAEILIIVLLKPALFTLIPAFNNIKGIAKFGIFVTGSSLVSSLNGNLADLMIGKMGSVSEVAFMSRAGGILNFLSNTISSGIKPVVTPYISQKKRDGGNYAEAFLYASTMLSTIVVPALAVAGYASLPLITAFFGEQWGASAPLASIMAISLSINFLNNLSPSLLITAGLERFLLAINLYTLFLNALSIYFLYDYGLATILWGGVLIHISRYLILLSYFKIKFELNIYLQLKMLSTVGSIVLPCLLWAFIFDSFIYDIDSQNVFVSIISLGITTSVIWILTIYSFKNPIAIELTGLLKKLIKK
jgi:O-antigen/teichoic acid export membrane protein